MKSGKRWLIPSLDATFYVASFLKTSEDASGDTRDGDFIWQGALTLNWNVLDGGGLHREDESEQGASSGA